MVMSTYVKKGGKITADGVYHTDDDEKVQAVTLKSGQGSGADGLTVGLSYVDKVTGSRLDDIVRMDTVADKDFGVMSLGKGYDTLVLTRGNEIKPKIPLDTVHRLKLTSVEMVKAAEGDEGVVTLDINGVGTFATDGSVNFMTSGRATSAKQTITYEHMVADTTVDLALGKDKIIFMAGTQFTIIDGNLVASHPDELGSVTFKNYLSSASNLVIQVLEGETKTYAQWFQDQNTVEYNPVEITLSNIAISAQEADGEDGSNAGDDTKDFVTNIAEQTITVQLSRDLSNGEQLLGSVDGGSTWVAVDVDYEDNGGEGTEYFGSWLTTLPEEGTNDIVFKVRAPNGAYLQVDGANEGHADALSQQYTLDQTAPDVGTLSFVSLASDADDPTATGEDADAITNQSSDSITFSYDGDDLQVGERFQYSTDGGTTWLDSVDGEGTTITVDGEDNTVTLDEVNFSTVGTLKLRVIDAAGNETTSAEDGGSFISQTITYDNTDPTWGEGVALSLKENDGGEDGTALSLGEDPASDTNGVTYSLATGGEDDNDQYTINASTGALTRKTGANYEEVTAETVVVTATDNAGNQSTQSFTINIQNVDEAGTLTISSNAEGYDYLQGSVLTANLTDIDGEVSNVTYTWTVGGEDVQAGEDGTYTLGLDDVGKQISVSATYTDPQGSGKTASSDSTHTVDALANQAITVAQALSYADAINNDHTGEDYVHDAEEHVQGSFYVQDSAANVVAATKTVLDKISADDGNYSDMGEDGNEIVIDNGTVGEDIAYGTEHDITMAQMDTLLNKGVVTANDGALQAQDVFYDIYDFYTSVQAGQSTQQGQSIIANADTVTAYGNAVGQQMDMLAFDRDLIIYGREGADTIYTGTGDNFVTGGSEGDVIIGDKGSDIIFAAELDQDITRANPDYGRWLWNEARLDIQAGDLSQVSVFDSAEEFFGEDINGDTLNGGGGNDYLYGDGSDTNDVNGNGKVDVLHGNGGDDVLVVYGSSWILGEDADQAYGDAGNDILIHSGWGWGYAELHGGTGNDVYYVQGGWSSVYENAGEDIDTVVVDGDSWSLDANFENLTNIGSGATLTGNDLDNVITGGVGEDTIELTGGGSDRVVFNVVDNLVTNAPGIGFDTGYDVITHFAEDDGDRDVLVFNGFTPGTGRVIDGSSASSVSGDVSGEDEAIISETASILQVTDSDVGTGGNLTVNIADAINAAFDLTSLENGEEMLFAVKAADIDLNEGTNQWWVGVYRNSGDNDDTVAEFEVQVVGLVTVSGNPDWDNFASSVSAFVD